jgi:hypothetical protein
MPANEDRLRAFATDHFLGEQGLGGKLSRAAGATIQALAQQEAAAILACGNILERTFWIGLGHWLGYFQRDIQPLSAQEKNFLVAGSDLLREHPWPEDFAHVLQLLSNVDVGASASFFDEEIIGSEQGSELPKGSTAFWPAFQAALILAEDLT